VNESRICYRARQFWETLTAPWRPRDAAYAPAHLSPALLDLFYTMSPAEQHHSIALAKAVAANAPATPDLLTAALLHDVGKTRAPPRLWERVIVVLTEHFTPALADRLSAGPPHGLRRGFVTHRHHAAWGADLAVQAGAAPRTVSLIRHHHDIPRDDTELTLLQKLDDKRGEKLANQRTQVH